MVRSPSPERLSDVAEAATRVFGRLGYQRTHMAEVATEAGLSAGAVYTYVESKEALFHLVFAHGFGLFAEELPPLPLPTPAPGETVALIEREMRKVPVPKMRVALEEKDPPDVGDELRGIVLERYAMLERLWPMLAVIERSAVDLPDLEAYYYGRARRSHHDQLARYLEMRAARGYLRPTPDPLLTARIVTESITWFAWHRHEGRDALLFDDDVVRETVVEFVCAGLLEPAP